MQGPMILQLTIDIFCILGLFACASYLRQIRDMMRGDEKRKQKSDTRARVTWPGGSRHA